MQLNVLTKPIGQVDTVFDSTVEYPFDMDIHLPEYMPDLERSLKCDMQLNLQNTSYSADRISVDGNGLVRILYVTSEGKFACFEQPLPISKSVQGKSGWNNAQIQVYPKLDYVNCRIVNQRKASVHGALSLRFVVKSYKKYDMIVGTECNLIQKKCVPMEVYSPTAYVVRSFSMSEVITLPEERGVLDRVIQSNACVSVDSTKTVKNKLLIKGNLIVDLLYTVESDGVSCLNYRHVMPISQIIEAEGIEEQDDQELVLRILSLEAQPKVDGNGESKLLDISAKIEASLLSGKNCSVELISDAYATKGVLNTEYEDVTISSFLNNIADTFTENCSIDLSANAPKELLFISATDLRCNMKYNDDKALVECYCVINALFINKQNEISICEKSISYIYKLKDSDDVGEILYKPSIQLIGCSGTITENGELDIKIETRVEASVFRISDCKALKSIALDDTMSCDSRSALTIYYASAGESVWNIARHYRTTVSAIKTENALDEDMIVENRMLIIPTV